MKYCPICERPLDCDTEVYVKRGKKKHESVEIIGCDNCVRSTWGDEVWKKMSWKTAKLTTICGI